MVKLSKLYTKTGDAGETGLVGGKRISKTSMRVKAYGEIDELNSFVGWARTETEALEYTPLSEELSSIQNQLFNIGSELATAPGDEYDGMITCKSSDSKELEHLIDQHVALVDELKSFVLPGGTELNSRLHIARTVCRRVERTVLELAQNEKVSQEVLVYFNRLSDYLFALARRATHEQAGTEYLWQPGEPKAKEK